MIYTKEEFKRLWESNEEGGGITFTDVADCARSWGLFSRPMTHEINRVLSRVLESANCKVDD